MKLNKETHESFGMIQVNRTQCSKAMNLFGSSIKHREVLSLSIYEGSKERMLNKDYHYAGEKKIEIVLSSAQFSDMITSFNTSPVPCTISYDEVQGDKESCPEVTEREKISNDFKEQMERIADRLESFEDKINSLVDKKGALNKSEKESIKRSSSMLIQSVRSDLPFIKKSYDESVEKTLKELKHEMEALKISNNQRQDLLQ
jgi:ElaB/YqjD/DUF883 family membrane-anchored ribosome-binding protein